MRLSKDTDCGQIGDLSVTEQWNQAICLRSKAQGQELTGAPAFVSFQLFARVYKDTFACKVSRHQVFTKLKLFCVCGVCPTTLPLKREDPICKAYAAESHPVGSRHFMPRLLTGLNPYTTYKAIFGRPIHPQELEHNTRAGEKPTAHIPRLQPTRLLKHGCPAYDARCCTIPNGSLQVLAIHQVCLLFCKKICHFIQNMVMFCPSGPRCSRENKLSNGY